MHKSIYNLAPQRDQVKELRYFGCHVALMFTTKNISLYFYGDLLMFFSFRFTHVEELQFWTQNLVFWQFFQLRFKTTLQVNTVQWRKIQRKESEQITRKKCLVWWSFRYGFCLWVLAGWFVGDAFSWYWSYVSTFTSVWSGGVFSFLFNNVSNIVAWWQGYQKSCLWVRIDPDISIDPVKKKSVETEKFTLWASVCVWNN